MNVSHLIKILSKYELLTLRNKKVTLFLEKGKYYSKNIDDLNIYYYYIACHNNSVYLNRILVFYMELCLILYPFFFLIPKLVINASKKIKSSAGFDSIAQAVESLISKKSN